MAYNPHTWATGETITAAQLNALEQGLSTAAGAGVSDSAVAAQVTSGTATQAALKATYGPLRASAFPLSLSLVGNPPVDATVATIGAVTNASSITGGRAVDPRDALSCAISGGKLAQVPTYPNRISVKDEYPGTSSTGPWSLDFDVDLAGAKIELFFLGNGGAIRLIVDGKLVTAGPTYTIPADGNWYFLPVTFPTAGVHRVRIQADGGGVSLQSINLVSVSDKLTPAARRGPRCMVVGDSFTEPTFSDSATPFGHDGWVQQLSLLTGWDCWSAGSGGTGYANPGAGGRRVFADRIAADILPYSPDVVVLAGGINDTGYTYAQVKAGATAALTALASVPTVLVLSPFWQGDVAGMPDGVVMVGQAIRDAAQAANRPYLDLITPADPSGLRSTVARPLSAGGARVYAAGDVREGTLGKRVLIGDASLGHHPEVVSLAASGADTSGGDYNYYLGSTVTTLAAHGVGEPVVAVGPSYASGTGRQGSPAGNGSADVDRGPDNSHPTIVGHKRLARTVARAIATALPV